MTRDMETWGKAWPQGKAVCGKCFSIGPFAAQWTTLVAAGWLREAPLCIKAHRSRSGPRPAGGRCPSSVCNQH
jgi:hypothetical protein